MPVELRGSTVSAGLFFSVRLNVFHGLFKNVKHALQSCLCSENLKDRDPFGGQIGGYSADCRCFVSSSTLEGPANRGTCQEYSHKHVQGFIASSC